MAKSGLMDVVEYLDKLLRRFKLGKVLEAS